MNMSRWMIGLAMVISIGGCGEQQHPEPQVVEGPQTAEPSGLPEKPGSTDAEQELLEDVKRARELSTNAEGSGQNLEDARKIILSVLRQDRDFAPAYVELARLEYRGGYLSGDDFERTRLINAEKFARKALELDPDLPEAHLTMSRINMYLGEYDRAEDSIATGASLGLDRSEVDTVRARMAQLQGNDAEALRIAREVLGRDDAADALKVELLDHVSSILERGGFREEARQMREQRIEIRPDGPWGHGNFAAFLLRHGETELALKHAKRAVEIMPYGIGMQTLARAYVARAEELHQQGDFADAGATIEEMSRVLGATSPDALEFLGNYYYGIFVRTNDASYLRRAEESYARAVELDPDRESAALALQRVRERVRG